MMFFIYSILFLIFIYKCKCNFIFFNKHYLAISFLIKVVFIFIISNYFNDYKYLKVPDEENYFHDVIIFNQLAKDHPMYYFQFLLDIEPKDETIFNKYYTSMNAWDKAPEFFYNDNRWVIKIHSVLAFISGYELSIHRLFSAILGLLGLLLVFQFLFMRSMLCKCFNNPHNVASKIKTEWIFLLASVSPAFFFFTSFVLKESLLIFFTGSILIILYQWIVENKFNLQNILLGSVLILISFFFRPAYLIPLIFFSVIFLAIKKYAIYNHTFKYLSTVLLAGIVFYFAFQFIFKKNIIDIIQYRQERFLDASKGGIFLINDKKFVRAPYNWDNLKCDSSKSPPLYSIKKDVPLMYWYLIDTDFTDTIIENNRDTIGQYKILYSIEKANKTIYIDPINKHKNIFYNINSVLQGLNVFFFYPQKINNISDIFVWIENILILLNIILLIAFLFKKQFTLEITYILMYVLCIVLIISITSPNTGALIRYRYFLTPILLTTTLLALHFKQIKKYD